MLFARQGKLLQCIMQQFTWLRLQTNQHHHHLPSKSVFTRDKCAWPRLLEQPAVWGGEAMQRHKATDAAADSAPFQAWRYLSSHKISWIFLRIPLAKNVVGRIAVKMMMDTRYKIWVLGVPLQGPSKLFSEIFECDCKHKRSILYIKEKAQCNCIPSSEGSSCCRNCESLSYSKPRNLADHLPKPLGPQDHSSLTRPVLFGSIPDQGEYEKLAVWLLRLTLVPA